MKTVIETATGRALYLFPDNALVSITDQGLVALDIRALDIKPETHSVVENVPEPTTWVGAAVGWDGTDWFTVDATRVAEVVEERLQAKRATAVISRFRMQEQLRRDGLLPQLQALLTAPGSDQTRVTALKELTEFSRLSQTVNVLRQALSMTEAQMDTLFENAALIEE